MTSNRDYSFFHLMDSLYTAKKAYYGPGRSHLTDLEFDALEDSIKAIHGTERFNEWNCVGYDPAIHEVIENRADQEMANFRGTQR